MEKETQILYKFVEAVRTDVVHSMQEKGRVATGQTIKDLQIVPGENGKIMLTGPEWLAAQEVGRKPTSPNAPKGDPTLKERIAAWAEAKGIDQKAVYPITKKIHEQGYKGKPGTLSSPLSDENIEKRLDEAAENLADLFVTNMLRF